MNSNLPRLATIRSIAYVIGMILVFSGLGTRSAEVEPAFLTETSDARASRHLMGGVPTGIRGRAVRAHPSLRQLSKVRLDVAAGLRLDAERIRVDVLPGGDFVWVGRLEGEPLSEVTLASRGGVLAGIIDRPLENGNDVYTITPSAGGVSVLGEFEGPAEGHDGCQTVSPAAGKKAKRSLMGTGLVAPATVYGAATAANPAIVDIMIAYTPATTTRHGGVAGVEALILQAISSANTAYQNSGVHLTLNLVHMTEVAYTEPGDMGVTLSRLATPLDNQLDSVHALRDQYGADIVVLLDQDSNYCGLSYLMGTPSTSFAPSAFSVVNSGCIGNYSLTHEVAHLMGSHHEREGAVGTPSYAYSYGQKRCATDGTGFRCVMAYACTSAVVPRVNYFSSPLVTFNGFPTGTAYETDPLNAADNARSLNNNAFYVAAFRTRPEPLPIAPAGLAAAVPDANTVALTWSDLANNETSSQLERSPDGVAWTQIASLGAGLAAFDDGTMLPSSSAWYRVRACNATGCSAWSGMVLATTPGAVLGTPTDLTAGVGSTPDAILVTWTDGATVETGTEIETSLDGIDWTLLATAGVNVTAVQQSGLAFGQSYSYRVRACDGGGCTAWAGPVSFTLAVPVPIAPGTLSGTAISSTRVDLTWVDRSTNESGFRLERSTNGVSFATIATVGAGVTGFSDTGVAAARTYYYRVFASNTYGESDSSAVASVTTPASAPPTAPDRLDVVTVSSSEIKLTWRDRSTNETGFRIERSTNGTTFTVVTTVAANSTSYRNTGLASRTKYYYRICSVKDSLSSAYTIVDSATTK